MTLWFDFDGTLVDVREKYLALYHAFCREHGAESILPDETFWRLKRDGWSNTKLAAQSGLPSHVADKFSGFIEANVEQETSLRRDRLFQQSAEVLRTLSTAHSCRLVSMRRDYHQLLRQLDCLGIRDCFDQILEVRRTSSTDFTPKAEAVNRLGQKERALIIGDSEMEIKTAQQLRIPSCAVDTGIRNANRLLALSPDYFIKTLPEVLSIVSGLDSGPR